MSYTVASSGPGRVRPGSVSVAVILLYVTAALTLIAAALGAYSTFGIEQPEVTSPGLDAETAQTTAMVISVVVLVLYAAVAVGFLVLASLVGKGRQPARIVTWTLGGIAVLCCGCGLVGNVAGTAMLGNMQGVDQSMIDDITAAIPGWFVVVDSTVRGLLVVCLLVAIILLALPASNDFFRKEQEVWTPPTWTGGEFPPPAGQFPPPPAGQFPPPPPPAGPLPPAPPPPPQQ